MQSRFPGSGALRQAMGQYAPMFASKETLEYRNWRRNLEAWFESPRRHELFGSALTNTEAQRWKLQALDPDSTKEQVDTAISNIERMLIPYHQRRVQAAKYQYRPEQVDALTGGGQAAPAEEEADWEVLPD